MAEVKYYSYRAAQKAASKLLKEGKTKTYHTPKKKHGKYPDKSEWWIVSY